MLGAADVARVVAAANKANEPSRYAFMNCPRLPSENTSMRDAWLVLWPSIALSALPGFPRGGWQGGRNWRTGGPDGALGGDSTVAPLIVENVREELDAPGEWFFDRDARRLYLIPNGTGTPPETVVASALATLVRIRGSAAAPARDIRLQGIGWRECPARKRMLYI